MPLHEEKSVRIDNCVIVWDGIKSPEQTEQGGFKYTLKVVVDPNNPDLAILEQLGKQCLLESAFKGQLPAGGHWIMKQVGAQEFGGLFPGWWCVNGITYQQPQVFDEQGNVLNAMQYGPAIFNGQKVNMLVSAKDYNQVSKGIKAQLEGIQIVASANAQPISIGGSSVSAASAFGGGGGAPVQGQPPAQPGYGAPVQGQPPAQQGYGAPAQGQPPAQQGYGAPAQGQPPAQHGAQPNPPAYGAGAPNAATQPGGASATTYPSNQQPVQANNFLPGQ